MQAPQPRHSQRAQVVWAVEGSLRHHARQSSNGVSEANGELHGMLFVGCLGGGEGGGGGGGKCGGDGGWRGANFGGEGGAFRVPQSSQSVPRLHIPNSDPSPPSSPVSIMRTRIRGRGLRSAGWCTLSRGWHGLRGACSQACSQFPSDAKPHSSLHKPLSSGGEGGSVLGALALSACSTSQVS